MAPPAIDAFLDACDTVLNSNTLLLCARFEGEPRDQKAVQAALRHFLDGGDFEERLYEADHQRDWHNLHDFDNDSGGYRRRAGVLVKPGVRLELARLSQAETELRMERMLTVDDPSGLFWSPYRKPLPAPAARALVSGLLWSTVVDAPWVGYSVAPNFCFSTKEARVSPKHERLSYFEGAEWASDSATLLVAPERMWLLLTNGCD